MKTRTVQVNEGENMGPIDFGYNFAAHYESLGAPPAQRKEREDHAVRQLRKLCNAPTLSGLQVRDGDYWYDVLDLGMYDGWPYWRPVPAVGVNDRVFGGLIWKFFYDIDDVREAQP